MLHEGRTTLEGRVDEQVLSAVRRAISASQGEIWLKHQQGPILGIVIGGKRAMVLRLAESGDAGFHAIDPEASLERSGEYVLANGQVDQCADRDTVELRHVVPIVTHFLATLDRWSGVTWQDDNAI